LAVKEHPYYQPKGTLKFDLAKAKASVAKYTAATGKSLDVVVPINTTAESLKGAQALCKMMEAAGMKCTGINPDSGLVEIIELPDHPYFLAAQFHPEYKSTVMNPHPLFVSFVKAAKEYHTQHASETSRMADAHN
jgi:hypothetical protein